MQTSNIELQLSFIAKALESFGDDKIMLDSDDLATEIAELRQTIELLNDDFNDKMEQLIEVINNGRDK